MEEGAEEVGTAAHLDAVCFCEEASCFEESDGSVDGAWVVEGAEGIDVHIKTGLLEFAAYAVCKAASEHHYLVGISNLYLTWIYLYVCL